MEAIIFLQSLGEWLVPIAEFFTFLGFEEFYLLIMPAIYWCVDSLIGARLAVMLVATTSLNGILKLAFHSPRPYWVSTDIKALSSETSFGIPSGHAQNAFALWGTWAGSLQRASGWLIAGIVILMIGLSRLALGMHFPIDVLLGWFFGGLLFLIFFRLEKPVLTRINSLSIRNQILTILLITFAILIIGNLMITILNFELPDSWVSNGILAGTKPDPLSRDGFTTASGVFLGLGLGLILMKQRGGFDPKGKIWKRFTRYLLGIVGTLALWAGLKAIFPSGEEFIPQAFRLVRYTSIGFWVSAGGPLVFMQFKLMDSK